MREVMANLKRKAGDNVASIQEGLDVRDELMPTSDGSHIALRIYTPIAHPDRTAAVIYIHGGGWTLGDLDGEDHPCRQICTQASVVVVSIDYRLSVDVTSIGTTLIRCLRLLVRPSSHFLGDFTMPLRLCSGQVPLCSDLMHVDEIDTHVQR